MKFYNVRVGCVSKDIMEYEGFFFFRSFLSWGEKSVVVGVSYEISFVGFCDFILFRFIRVNWVVCEDVIWWCWFFFGLVRLGVLGDVKLIRWVYLRIRRFRVFIVLESRSKFFVVWSIEVFFLCYFVNGFG